MNAIQTPGSGPETSSPSHGCCGSGMGWSSGTTAGSGIGRYVPGFLKGRRGIIIAALAVVGGGMAMGWPTLVALGAAPIILSLLPCAAMCALGMCMMGGKKSEPATVQNAAANAIGQGSNQAALGATRNAAYGQVIDMEPDLAPVARDNARLTAS